MFLGREGSAEQLLSSARGKQDDGITEIDHGHAPALIEAPPVADDSRSLIFSDALAPEIDRIGPEGEGKTIVLARPNYIALGLGRGLGGKSLRLLSTWPWSTPPPE